MISRVSVGVRFGSPSIGTSEPRLRSIGGAPAVMWRSDAFCLTTSMRISEKSKFMGRLCIGRSRARPVARYRVPATRAISAIEVRPRRTFSRPSSRRRIMPSCTAAWAMFSEGSRATASARIVSETHMTS